MTGDEAAWVGAVMLISAGTALAVHVVIEKVREVRARRRELRALPMCICLLGEHRDDDPVCPRATRAPALHRNRRREPTVWFDPRGLADIHRQRMRNNRWEDRP